ncbi:3-oxoacid CoA-transferase subunit B [Lawsonibacter celer]|jgi:acetate CoA/acetoacetate CoA-transferase beta subunit|uniref:3-oxoacid CoA-transferase subunit B n=1 Tax=Lawsonibacter celer TaxID=2986526 RepID=UPI001646B73E|nr:3-oxoacid CoA-transferase subunit B [Lawsonibacter celer]
MEHRERIARRAARFFRDGGLVNLGIGLPTQVVNYIPEGIHVQLQSENGFIGIGPIPDADGWDHDVVNAGGRPASILPGGCTFDSAMSFGLIRGGHVDATVLGALEVDQEGNLANWIIPGRKVPGMGGGMDLVVGARLVIVAMEHCTKAGAPKILRRCTLPLTAPHSVDYIVTELCVLHYNGAGLILEELAPGITVEEVRTKTQAELILPEQIGRME